MLYFSVTLRVTRMVNSLAEDVLSYTALVHLMPGAHEIMQQSVDHSFYFPYNGVTMIFGITIVFLLHTFLRKTALALYTPLALQSWTNFKQRTPQPRRLYVL